MTTVQDIINQMIYETTIIQELDSLRREEHRTNKFIDVVIYSLSCLVITQFLGLTDYNNSRKYEDDLMIDPLNYTEAELSCIEYNREKYKEFRNKVVAHTTTTEVVAYASVKDLINLISILRQADVVLCDSGRLKNYLKQMLHLQL